MPDGNRESDPTRDRYGISSSGSSEWEPSDADVRALDALQRGMFGGQTLAEGADPYRGLTMGGDGPSSPAPEPDAAPDSEPDEQPQWLTDMIQEAQRSGMEVIPHEGQAPRASSPTGTGDLPQLVKEGVELLREIRDLLQSDGGEGYQSAGRGGPRL